MASKSASQTEEGMLSPAVVEQYWNQGYCSPCRVLPAGEVAGLRARVESFEAGQGGKLLPAQRNKAHLLFDWLDDLIRDPRVLDPIESLIGPDILCWNTLFWIKEPNTPTFVSWHQDKHYWGLENGEVITAWLALSPATEENGCMRVKPGSHEIQMTHEDRYDEANMLTRGQEISDEIDEAQVVLMPLQPGEMSLHSVRTAHASGPNQSNDRRIGVSMHFMPPSTQQRIGSWDSAALVRGKDAFENFTHTPRLGDPKIDIAAFHARASQAVHDIVYHGADTDTAKL